jgi:ABC-type amino acid transport substrate-binding protein
MDYLGRELVILAKMPDDYGMLQKREDELEKDWSNLRPQIMLRNGQALAIKIDQTMDQIKAAADHQKIVQKGKVILDLVDEIENLFK